MRLCYISRNYRGIESSGNKAKTDNEISLTELNAHNLGLHTTYYNSKIITFLLDLAGIIKMTINMKKDDVILLQYPIKKYFAYICNVAHFKGAKTITIIHDLGSMRRKKLTVEKEINRLMHTDYVIASNKTMAEWLNDKGFSNSLGALQLFDYRSESLSPLDREEKNIQSDNYRVVYAGALAKRKNTFLLKVAKQIKNYQLEIFGNKEGLPGLENSDHVHIHGFMKSEDFIHGVKGDLGLVWDGDSLDTCSGSFGEYLRWNSPHKASFYLRAGLPLIVWKESALAPIVEQENIGFCINHIDDIDTILKNITDEEIEAKRKNVRRVSENLQRGIFFKTAINKAISILD